MSDIEEEIIEEEIYTDDDFEESSPSSAPPPPPASSSPAKATSEDETPPWLAENADGEVKKEEGDTAVGSRGNTPGGGDRAERTQAMPDEQQKQHRSSNLPSRTASSVGSSTNTPTESRRRSEAEGKSRKTTGSRESNERGKLEKKSSVASSASAASSSGGGGRPRRKESSVGTASTASTRRTSSNAHLPPIARKQSDGGGDGSKAGAKKKQKANAQQQTDSSSSTADTTKKGDEKKKKEAFELTQVEAGEQPAATSTTDATVDDAGDSAGRVKRKPSLRGRHGNPDSSVVLSLQSKSDENTPEASSLPTIAKSRQQYHRQPNKAELIAEAEKKKEEQLQKEQVLAERRMEKRKEFVRQEKHRYKEMLEAEKHRLFERLKAYGEEMDLDEDAVLMEGLSTPEVSPARSTSVSRQRETRKANTPQPSSDGYVYRTSSTGKVISGYAALTVADPAVTDFLFSGKVRVARVPDHFKKRQHPGLQKKKKGWH